jgi:hypothetical protein
MISYDLNGKILQLPFRHLDLLVADMRTVAMNKAVAQTSTPAGSVHSMDMGFGF